MENYGDGAEESGEQLRAPLRPHLPGPHFSGSSHLTGGTRPVTSYVKEPHSEGEPPKTLSSATEASIRDGPQERQSFRAGLGKTSIAVHPGMVKQFWG